MRKTSNAELEEFVQQLNDLPTWIFTLAQSASVSSEQTQALLQEVYKPVYGIKYFRAHNGNYPKVW